MRHEFVEYIPEKPEDGVLYISMQYKTTLHLCACGCKKEVFTSLSPVGWRLIYNGESVSLDPSIGNWDFPCQSHYWIKNGQVIWAESWSKEQINSVKRKEVLDKAKYFNASTDSLESKYKPKARNGIWSKIKSLFFK